MNRHSLSTLTQRVKSVKPFFSESEKNVRPLTVGGLNAHSHRYDLFIIINHLRAFATRGSLGTPFITDREPLSSQPGRISRLAMRSFSPCRSAFLFGTAGEVLDQNRHASSNSEALEIARAGIPVEFRSLRPTGQYESRRRIARRETGRSAGASCATPPAGDRAPSTGRCPCSAQSPSTTGFRSA